MKISVIIPTYNRPASLVRTLESLKHLRRRKNISDDFEVIVVNNGDVDVHEIFLELIQKSGFPGGYVVEQTVGLHNARHAGVRAAEGDLLVFTDDDASFSSNWLAAYAHALSRHPGMAAAGGPIRPIWEATPPKWVLDLVHERPWLLGLMEPSSDFRIGKEAFFGGNMAIRRDDLLSCGGSIQIPLDSRHGSAMEKRDFVTDSGTKVCW